MIDNPMGVQHLAPLGANGTSAAAPGSRDVVSGFGQVLNRAIDAVNTRQAESAELAKGLVSGQHANIHETMIAMEKSSISFRLMTKVHQKGLDAYQEVMRMQL